MKEVFISYESSNQKMAEKLVEVLEKCGHDCWIATRDVPKGDPYDDHIPKAIAECCIVVMLFSEASLNSPHVKKELRAAVKHDKRIIPFMLEDVQLREAFEYHIESNNRISADKNWNQAVEELLTSMETKNAEIPMKKSTARLHSNYVCCPHCKCTVLKHKIGDVDRHLYPALNETRTQRTHVFCAKTAWFYGAISSFLAICIIIFFFASLNNAAGLLLGSIFYILSLYYVYDLCELNIQGKLIRAIKHSQVKYYTFKCADCGKEFGVLLPQDKPLEDFVEKLLIVTK